MKPRHILRANAEKRAHKRPPIGDRNMNWTITLRGITRMVHWLGKIGPGELPGVVLHKGRTYVHRGTGPNGSPDYIETYHVIVP